MTQTAQTMPVNPFEADRMQDIPFSNIRQVFERVTELTAQGRPPIAFHIGQPDFDTPAHIKQAAQAALEAGLTAYTSNYGLPELRRAIAAKLATDNDLHFDPDTEVIVTVGTNEAILLAMLAHLNPGDEVLVPDPMWLHYFYCARLAGARVVGVPLREANGFQLDPDDLERLWTPRTKMLVINSPHNPTGAVFGRETLAGVARFVSAHGLLLLSDEIYEKMLYGEQTHLSPGVFPEIADQTITINGFSKSYAMTGWRVGYLAARRPLVRSMIRVHQYTTICATSFAQAGAVAALTGAQATVQQMLAEFRQRRAVVVAALQALPGVTLAAPQGAFYAFPNIAQLDPDSGVVARRLLDEAGVAVIAGRAFGPAGEGFLRLSFACSLPDVQRGMQALTTFWQAHQPHPLPSI
jgi:aspartate/methionine/tyrosine aminotransferase